MSVTTSYKTATFSPAECFAVVRGLRTRIDLLTAQLAATVATGDEPESPYLEQQLAAAHDALAQLNGLPFMVRV
ncbi:hypothetical protein [Duganella qianjiadongensis]|uniref:Uncharacterized protein n=1 Tax=Duganella qianjiadongensis TaxID=2692176 RepID=A0ABW9VJ58_9BURK|nr:hypothetical protein [Duganella qianjiadongensis]MYM39644.1 hypothetical protein [Duganella qianjiadongensis]